LEREETLMRAATGTLASVVVLGLACITHAPEARAMDREIQANFLVNPVGVMYLGQLELHGTERTSLQVIVGGYDYDSWDGSYNEWGSGMVIGAMGKFYTEDNREGVYWGAGLVFVSGDFNWYDSPSYGYGSVSGLAPAVSLGYKRVMPNGKLVIEPNLIVAYVTGGDSTIDLIPGAGIAIGAKF
jgi:hypothetical protein